jgi:glycosyltransferase involved in cell wall biosynthesis
MYNVLILMSSYNGEIYINEQIESILAQTGVNIKLLIRDDGSKDSTVEIINEYTKQYSCIELYQGGNLGPALSFFDLIVHAPDYDYYAFSDQDDVWEKDKIQQAIGKISSTQEIPSLYISRAKLFDAELNEIAYRYKKFKVKLFKEAVLNNNATGCTMVFNYKLMEKLKIYVPRVNVMHDHWTYLLNLAIEGFTYADENSYIKYRQHSNNAIGGRKRYLKKFISKINMLIRKDKNKSKVAVEILNGFSDAIGSENLKTIVLLRDYCISLKNKIKLYHNINGKNTITNIQLLISILFGAL